MPGVPTTIEKTPTADTSVNKPASGTYGEKAGLARLQQSLPGSPGQGGQQGPSPMPERNPSGPPQPPGRPANAPGNIPGAVMAPTNHPNVPLGTPLQSGPTSPVAGAPDATAARIAVLTQLTQSQEVSAVTRQWATYVLEMLIAAKR